jgi:hypothetical protein
MRIFTQKFFRLSEADQAAVVDATLRDLRNQHYASVEDERKAEQEAKRIEKKACRLGILGQQPQGSR